MTKPTSMDDYVTRTALLLSYALSVTLSISELVHTETLELVGAFLCVIM